MTKAKLKLYRINPDYGKFLSQFDNRVPRPNFFRGNRQLVGITVRIKARLYFVPLVSPKQKHFKQKDSDLTSFRLFDGELFIGSLLLNNMIPIKLSLLEPIKISEISDHSYQNLLQKNYFLLKPALALIETKAQRLYDLVTNYQHAYLAEICCDFMRLEEVCDNYLVFART